MGRRLRMRSGAAALTLSLLATLSDARAVEPDPCAPEATLSPCFDADALWLPVHSGGFVTLSAPRAVELGAPVLALGLGVAARPVVLTLPSPHPEGIELEVVEATSTVTIGTAFGLGKGFDVRVALPFTPHQIGRGTGAVTSQQSPPLERVAVRDPRVALAWQALAATDAAPAAALGARLELAPPLGDETLLAGAAGPTVAPALAAELRAGRFAAGLDAGLRLRRAVRFGTVRKGSEGAVGAALSADLLSSPRLALGVETWLRPSLSGPALAGARDLPAEWLATTKLAFSESWSVALASGSGLPLALAPNSDGTSSSALAVTTPAWRALFALRYLPARQ